MMICTQSPNINATLVKLISWQKWYLVSQVLQFASDDHQNMLVFDDRVSEHRLPEEHIIHLACQHQAPYKIIELLADKFPQSISCPESKGRYPIHIACAKGLSPKTIEFIIESFPGAVGVQDDFGKNPLHYACESYVYNWGTIPNNAYRSPDKNLLTVVSMLLDEVPELPNVEDLHGMNAIEYAIDSDTNIKVVKRMQNASRENWRTMKKVHRGKSHEELRHSITSLGSSLNSFTFSSENLGSLHQEKKDRDVTAPSTQIVMVVAKAPTATARTA
mmetsp:Transcript_13417/g.24031  ORF Transcript_13417/g.24031 Transcript_13417/m.24031 type:complete len:275 (-) Transcript_13417:54-878(-)